MTKRKTATSQPTPRARAPHPRSVPVPDAEAEIDIAPDHPFEEGAHDAIGPDLRHRMISEAAYYRYAQRGYTEGFDVDDWTAAEAEIDHLLLNPESDAETSDAA
jgi:hypothetical protein